MENLDHETTIDIVLEDANMRNPRETVMDICTLLRNIEGDNVLKDMAIRISLYLRRAPDIFLKLELENGRKIDYSSAVCKVVKKLIEYEVYDEFILRYYPSLIKDIICGRLPLEIESLIEGLTTIPLLLPGEYILFRQISGIDGSTGNQIEVASRSYASRESLKRITVKDIIWDIFIAILEIVGKADRFIEMDGLKSSAEK